MTGLVDYKMGNLQSVRNSCEFLGEQVRLVSSARELEGLSHLVLPGVGAFFEGMSNLEKQGLVEAIGRRVERGDIFLLGICLGMQLLADEGHEGGDKKGMGLVKGDVHRLEDTQVRLPHIGWNNIKIRQNNPLLPNEFEGDFYFVHSFFLDAQNPQNVIATCDYGREFPCAVQSGNVFGVQFHPEKSHGLGLELLKRFFKLRC